MFQTLVLIFHRGFSFYLNFEVLGGFCCLFFGFLGFFGNNIKNNSIKNFLRKTLETFFCCVMERRLRSL